MKTTIKILSLTAALVWTSFVSAQTVKTEGASGSTDITPGTVTAEKNVMLNLYGGILRAAEYSKTDNSHWIKKGQFINRSSTVTVDFSDRLYVNNIPVIEQVEARHGYVVFFSDNFDHALIYIADEKGNLSSDELYINLK